MSRKPEDKTATVSFYDTFAQTYWQRHNMSPAESLTKFSKLLPGPKVLDLGSGGGRDALFLSQELGVDVTAADISRIMCQEARKKGLKTVLMDQENLAFRPASFDGVWSRVSLLHSPPECVPRILRELAAILRENGALFVGMKTSNGSPFEEEVKTTENGTTYYCYWQPTFFTNMVINSGFQIREVAVSKKKDFFGERNYFDLFAVKVK